jgi:Fic family protein
VDTVQRLDALAKRDRERIRQLGRAAGSALQVHHELLIRPVSTPMALAARCGLSHVTVNKTLAHLANLDIVRELTGHTRHRIFSYAEYLAILNEGTELPGETGR